MVRTKGQSQAGPSRPPKGRKETAGAPKPKPRKDIVRNMRLWPEKGINLEALQSTTIPEIIAQMNWQRLAAQPHRINSTVVREFYLHANQFNMFEEGVRVRGRVVHINPEIINDYFQVHRPAHHLPYENEGFPNLPEFRSHWTPQVAEEVRTYPRRPWTAFSYVDHRELNAPLAFFNIFQAKNIWALHTHQKLTHLMPNVILCIHRRQYFDVGQVICANLKWQLGNLNYLVFPSLITYLCEAAQVPFHSTDKWEPASTPMGTWNYNRVATERGEQHVESDEEEDEDYAADPAEDFSSEDVSLEEENLQEGEQINMPPFNEEATHYGGDTLTQILASLQALQVGHQQILANQQVIMETQQAHTNALWGLGTRFTGLEEQFNQWNQNDPDNPIQEDEDQAEDNDPMSGE